MFEQFTSMSRKAVAIANQHTHRLGGNVIGDVELLLGICSLPACNAAVLLCGLKLDLQSLRSALQRQQRSLAVEPAPARLPQSLHFKQVLVAAIATAESAGHGWVGTDHLLLGMMNCHDAVSSRVLAEFGLTADHVRATVLAAFAARREP
jgi:ATP-dependent Clp protease ATP-binding subunit ClpC